MYTKGRHHRQVRCMQMLQAGTANEYDRPDRQKGTAGMHARHRCKQARCSKQALQLPHSGNTQTLYIDTVDKHAGTVTRQEAFKHRGTPAMHRK